MSYRNSRRSYDDDRRSYNDDRHNHNDDRHSYDDRRSCDNDRHTTSCNPPNTRSDNSNSINNRRYNSHQPHLSTHGSHQQPRITEVDIMNRVDADPAYEGTWDWEKLKVSNYKNSKAYKDRIEKKRQASLTTSNNNTAESSSVPALAAVPSLTPPSASSSKGLSISQYSLSSPIKVIRGALGESTPATSPSKSPPSVANDTTTGSSATNANAVLPLSSVSVTVPSDMVSTQRDLDVVQSTIRLLEKALRDRNVLVDITAVFQSLPARQQDTPVQASLNDDAAPNGGLSGQTEGFSLIADDGEVGDDSLVFDRNDMEDFESLADSTRDTHATSYAPEEPSQKRRNWLIQVKNKAKIFHDCGNSPMFQRAASYIYQISQHYLNDAKNLPLNQDAALIRRKPLGYLYEGLTFSNIEDMIYSGEWLYEQVIDYFVINSTETLAGDGKTAYLPFQSPTVGILGRSWDEAGQQLSVAQKLNDTIGDAMINNGILDFQFDPLLSEGVETVLFPYNPTGRHWIIIKASNSPIRTIIVYDSFRIGSECHEGTWECATQELQAFMTLLGYYHPVFFGDWPIPVLGPCVKQHRDDCGIFAIHNCRALLSDAVLMSMDIGDPTDYARRYRAHYLGEFLAMLEDKPLDTYAGNDSISDLSSEDEMEEAHAEWVQGITYKSAIASILKGSEHSLSLTAIVDKYMQRMGKRMVTARKSARNCIKKLLESSQCFIARDNGLWELDEKHRFWDMDSDLLFSSDRHIADDQADDIQHSFDLVICLYRISSKKQHGGFENEGDKTEDRTDKLYKSWFSRFGQHIEEHTRVTDPSEWEYGTRSRFSHCVAASSNNLLFSNCELRKSTYTEDVNVNQLLETINDNYNYRNRRCNVLILQTGLDGSTTLNDSWGNLHRQWPSINFHLTIAASLKMGATFPKVFKARGASCWAHFEVRILDDLRRHSIEEMLKRDPKHGRLIATFYEISDMKESQKTISGMREANQSFSYAGYLTRNVGFRNRVSLSHRNERLCERCNEVTAGIWHRGALDAENIICSECVPVVPIDERREEIHGSDSNSDSDSDSDPDSGSAPITPSGPSATNFKGAKAPSKRSRPEPNDNIAANVPVPKRNKTIAATNVCSVCSATKSADWFGKPPQQRLCRSCYNRVRVERTKATGEICLVCGLNNRPRFYGRGSDRKCKSCRQRELNRVKRQAQQKKTAKPGRPTNEEQSNDDRELENDDG